MGAGVSWSSETEEQRTSRLARLSADRSERVAIETESNRGWPDTFLFHSKHELAQACPNPCPDYYVWYNYSEHQSSDIP